MILTNAKKLALGLIGIAVLASSCQKKKAEEIKKDPPPVTTSQLTQNILIGNLDNKDGKYQMGSGCYFSSSATGDDIYAGEEQSPAHGWMMIDGKVEKLLEEGTPVTKDINGVQHNMRTHHTDGIIVTIDTVNKGKGEETEYAEGVITVQKGSKTESIDVKGGCGS